GRAAVRRALESAGRGGCLRLGVARARGARDVRPRHARSARDALPALSDHAAEPRAPAAPDARALAAHLCGEPGAGQVVARRRRFARARGSVGDRPAGVELRAERASPAVRAGAGRQAGALFVRRAPVAPALTVAVTRPGSVV